MEGRKDGRAEGQTYTCGRTEGQTYMREDGRTERKKRKGGRKGETSSCCPLTWLVRCDGPLVETLLVAKLRDGGEGEVKEVERKWEGKRGKAAMMKD
jgi:hypothetical protein